MTQSELEETLGHKSRSTIAKIESEVNDIVQSQVIQFAKDLKVSPAYLMGWESDNLQSVSLDKEYGTIKVPVYGEIPAGQPLEAIEDVSAMKRFPQSGQKAAKSFCSGNQREQHGAPHLDR